VHERDGERLVRSDGFGQHAARPDRAFDALLKPTPEEPDKSLMGSIDPSVLTGLALLGGTPVVEMMLDTAIRAMRDQIDALCASADRGDFGGVAAAAHALISSAGSVGAVGVCDAARTIEAEASRDRLDPATSEISTLRRRWSDFVAEVEERQVDGWGVPPDETP
jgi:HPt (histidine-containing phosphotransfer) domain-containing protein